jgi:transcriptional antiterminator RfaH
MNIASMDEPACWYAIRTRPKQEDRADVNLRAWQVPTFVPKLKGLRRSGYVGRHASKPLFTRYIFARFDASRLLHKINYTRGVESVVSFGGSLVPIDDKIIDLIKDRVDEDGFIRLGEELKYGDKVTIKFGPLKNLGGIFQKRMKASDRVRILLNAASYQSHLLIDREMIERVN